MTKSKIIAETVPNPHCKVYHVSIEISQSYIERFMRPIRETSEEYLEKVGEVGAQIVRETLAIPGVTEASIQPYQIQVLKGQAFDWDDIEPVIIEALKKAFGEKFSEVDVTNSTMFFKEDKEDTKEDLELSGGLELPTDDNL